MAHTISLDDPWCTAPRHRFSPGPVYWSDRCLICSHWRQDEEDHGMHIPWWKFWERTDKELVKRLYLDWLTKRND